MAQQWDCLPSLVHLLDKVSSSAGKHIPVPRKRHFPLSSDLWQELKLSPQYVRMLG